PRVESADTQVAAGVAAGVVTGTAPVSRAIATGSLAASWTSSAANTFLATSLAAPAATVRDPGGNVVGTGGVNRTVGRLTPASVSGGGLYSVTGNGNLSFYGPAETSLGVSGNWDNYTANVAGNVTITITTDG